MSSSECSIAARKQCTLVLARGRGDEKSEGGRAGRPLNSPGARAPAAVTPAPPRIEMTAAPTTYTPAVGSCESTPWRASISRGNLKGFCRAAIEAGGALKLCRIISCTNINYCRAVEALTSTAGAAEHAMPLWDAGCRRPSARALRPRAFLSSALLPTKPLFSLSGAFPARPAGAALHMRADWPPTGHSADNICLQGGSLSLYVTSCFINSFLAYAFTCFPKPHPAAPLSPVVSLLARFVK